MSKNAIEEMLQKMSSAGWDGLRVDPSATARQFNDSIERQVEEVRPIARFLMTPDGQRFMAWLATKTVWRSEDETHQAMEPGRYGLEAARRNGQNGVFFMLVQVILQAGGVPAVPIDDKPGEQS